MATARINLTVDATAKEEALKLFDIFGLDASTAVNMFFKSVVRTKSIPFDISIANDKSNIFDMSNNEFMGAVQRAIDTKDDAPERAYTVTMDLNEKKPYKLFNDGRREYIE